MPENQQPIAERVHADSRNAGEQRGPGPVQGGENGTEREEHEIWRKRPLQPVEISAGLSGEVPRFAQSDKDRRCEPKDGPARQREREGAEERLVGRAAGPGEIVCVGADHARDDRRRRADDAYAEEQHGKIEIIAKRAGGESLGRQPAEHHHVGGRHGAGREIRDDQRRAQKNGPRRSGRLAAWVQSPRRSADADQAARRLALV